MKGWEYDTFKKAEKARRWRGKKRISKIYTKPKRKSWFRRNKNPYGQPTTIRHKGLR